MDLHTLLLEFRIGSSNDRQAVWIPFQSKSQLSGPGESISQPGTILRGKVDDRIPQRHRRMVGDKRFFRLPIHPLSKPVEMIRVREHVEHGDRDEWLARGATFLKR